jgi:hypothetical protein
MTEDTRHKHPGTSMTEDAKPQQPGLEGEGNYTAAREYDAQVEKTAKSGKVERKAKAAKRALEGREGAELRRAEAEGKRHSHGEDPALHDKK